jgi:hypothetical protein
MEFIYPYTVEYFNVIIDILEKKGKMTFNKLFQEWVKTLRQYNIQFVKNRKRKHSKPTKFTPSKKVFSNILNKMVDDSYLRKEVNEKSKLTLKEINYQLTENAKKLLQMNILKMDNKQPVFKRIYEEFFTIPDFFEAVYKKALLEDPSDELYEKIPLSERIVKQITIKSDFEFDTFLKNLDIRQDKLEWGVVSYGGKSSMIADILYPFDISPARLEEQKKLYWNEEKGQTKLKEKLMLICIPIKETQEDLDFWIRRIEEWEIEKKGRDDINPNLISREFFVFISGVTTQDILQGNDGLLEGSEVEVQEGIDILKRVGLIKAKTFGMEIRYIIADNQLHDLISGIKTALMAELGYLLTKWEWFEVPTPQERERMECIFGKKEFGKLSTSLELKLFEHKKSMRKCKNVDEYHELFYENSSSFQRLASGITLDGYKESRRKKPVTRKEHLQDVKRYRQHLREQLQRFLDELIMNYDEEGIEELKMDFGEIIEKYSFIRDIVRKICPKVFEPPNKELQKAIIQREVSREMALTEFAKHMEAITPLSMETDRRTLKYVEYIQVKNGRFMPVLNLDKMSDEQLSEEK